MRIQLLSNNVNVIISGLTYISENYKLYIKNLNASSDQFKYKLPFCGTGM